MDEMESFVEEMEEQEVTNFLLHEQLQKLLSLLEVHIQKRTLSLKNKHLEIQEDMKKLRKDKEILEEDKAKFQEEINCTRKILEEEKKKMESVYQFQGSKIKLDVGGFHFTTSKSTLTNLSNTMLSSMFSGRFSLKTDEDGSYFIDRDGTHFRYILNFLRDGTIQLPTTDKEIQELIQEAQYYGINDLIQFINKEVEGNCVSSNWKVFYNDETIFVQCTHSAVKICVAGTSNGWFNYWDTREIRYYVYSSGQLEEEIHQKLPELPKLELDLKRFNSVLKRGDWSLSFNSETIIIDHSRVRCGNTITIHAKFFTFTDNDGNCKCLYKLE